MFCFGCFSPGFRLSVEPAIFCFFVCKLYFKVFLYFTDQTVYRLLARQIREYYLTF